MAKESKKEFKKNSKKDFIKGDKVKTSYGLFTTSQVNDYVKEIQRMVFWCILYTDPKTSGEYPDINVASYQKNIMKKIVGFNTLLSYPKEMMDVIVTLESALNLLKSSEYTFAEYRKLILDAGATAGKLKVGDANGCI